MSSDLDLSSSSSRQVAEDPLSFQLISGDGSLNANSLSKFVQSVNLSRCNVSYAVVAIMGPQSSGKSTLLNNLFSTNFDMMDATYGRKQMTKGIWMAKAADIDPLTMVLDIEGNDGKERGQGHPFERQTALFALALADVVLINMWCHDIGREAGANKPLLRTVFEAMAQSFSPTKTTLLFVIRDKTRTPLSYLEATVRDDLQKIWGEVKKREEYKSAAFGDFFTVQFTSLCHYELAPDQFIAQVAELKKLFENSIAPGGIAGEREGRVPGSAFSINVDTLWKSIQQNKNLDLPAHKTMVATVRCQDIAKDKLSQLQANQSWLQLHNAAKSGPVPNFGKQMTSIIAHYLSEYDKEVMYFDKKVRDDVRHQLQKNIFEDVKPAHEMLLQYYLSQSKENFVSQLNMMLARGEGFANSVRDCYNSCLLDFDKQCQDVVVDQATHWNAKIERKKLVRAIKDHSSALRDKSLLKIVAQCEKNLSENLEGGVIEAMEVKLKEGRGGESCWPWIRAILVAETATATSEFMSLVSGFELDDLACEKRLKMIIQHGRGIVEKKAREEGARVFAHMKNRFTSSFSLDTDCMPRQWAAGEDINKIARESRSLSLKILSDLAIIRLEETPDNVQEALFYGLMNESTSGAGVSAGDLTSRKSLKNVITAGGPADPLSIKSWKNALSGGVSGDPLSSKTWEDVPSSITIITPIKCKTLWGQLLQDTVNIIRHAHQTQDANKTRDAALAAAEAANREVFAKQEAATAAEKAKLEAVGAAAVAEAALELAKAEAALELAQLQAEIAAANAEKAEALARAIEAENEIKRRDAKFCSII